MTASCEQLDQPLHTDDRVLEERLPGVAGRWARISLHEHDRTVRLRAEILDGRGPVGLPAQLVLRLSSPASCTVDGRSCGLSDGRHSKWDLRVNDAHDDGPFSDIHWWVLRQLWDARLLETEDGFRHQVGAFDLHERPEHQYASKRMSEVCEIASERAIALSDVATRSIALQLERDARFVAYAALLDDRTGRVAQMVDICPGLFTLATVLNPFGTKSRALIGGIRAGRTLTDLLELVLPDAAESFGAAGSTVQVSRSAKALVRFAPAMPLDELLHVLHAPGLDINDVVRAGDAAGLWYRTMHEWAQCARGIKDRARANRVGGFLSKHAVEIQRRDPETQFVSEMMDWLDEAGATPPGRDSSVARVRRSIDEWHRKLRDSTYAAETRLSVGPSARQELGGITVSPIETVGQLVAEGAEMRNCVAAYAAAAIRGSLFFYRATVLGARVTIAITCASKKWSLREASGVANRRLQAAETALIVKWVDALS